MATPVRLQRYLAAAGVAARRKAEDLITAGRVTVNGKVVNVLGTKIDPDNDRIQVDGEAVVALGIGFAAELGHLRAVHRDAAGGDQLLGLAAGCDSGGSDDLLETLLHDISMVTEGERQLTIDNRQLC